jgi:hypothetical protein
MDLIKQNATALLVMVCVAMIGVLVSAVVASAIFIGHLRLNVEIMSPQTYTMHIRLIVLVVIQVKDNVC